MRPRLHSPCRVSVILVSPPRLSARWPNGPAYTTSFIATADGPGVPAHGERGPRCYTAPHGTSSFRGCNDGDATARAIPAYRARPRHTERRADDQRDTGPRAGYRPVPPLQRRFNTHC